MHALGQKQMTAKGADLNHVVEGEIDLSDATAD